MYIYIDESGSFVSAAHNDAWNVVAAYVSPESDKRNLKRIITKIKLKSGKTYKDEIKLNSLTEEAYFELLSELQGYKGKMFAVATDSSLMNDQIITHHKKAQAEKITEHRDKMLHKEGKKMLENLAEQTKIVSPQLYVQLICQVELIANIIEKGLPYFAQISPKNLGKFWWRIDQKNLSKNNYEEAFERLTPTFLQTRALGNPFIYCSDFDFSAMEHYFYTEENAPTYQKEVYGLEANTIGALNIGKFFWDDIEFENSNKSIGIQVADLLASGLRRMLRGDFMDNERAAELLGSLMIQPLRNGWPIDLISFVDASVTNKVTVMALDGCRNAAIPILQ